MKIITKRLYFKKWNLNDTDFCVDGLNDFEVAKNITSPFPYTKQDAIDFIQKFSKDAKNNYYFAVVKKDNNKVIGGTNISIHENGGYKGGLWLHRDFQGQGFGTELWTARAKFAFDYMGAKEITKWLLLL